MEPQAQRSFMYCVLASVVCTITVTTVVVLCRPGRLLHCSRRRRKSGYIKPELETLACDPDLIRAHALVLTQVPKSEPGPVPDSNQEILISF
jgi:hypothetical protein